MGIVNEILSWIQICYGKLAECRMKTPNADTEILIKCHQYQGNGCSQAALLQHNEFLCDKTTGSGIPGFDVRPIQEEFPPSVYNSGFMLTLTIPRGKSTSRRNYLLDYQSNSEIDRCVVIEVHSTVNNENISVSYKNFSDVKEVNSTIYNEDRTKDVDVLIKLFPVKGRTTFRFTITLLCDSLIKFPTRRLSRWGNSGNENWTLGLPSASWKTTITYLEENATIKIWFVKAPHKYKFNEYIITLRRLKSNGDTLSILEEKRVTNPAYIFEDVPQGRYRIGIEPYDDQRNSVNRQKCKNKYRSPQVCTVSETDIIEIHNISVPKITYDKKVSNVQNKPTLNLAVLFSPSTPSTTTNDVMIVEQKDRTVYVTTGTFKASQPTVITGNESTTRINNLNTAVLIDDVVENPVTLSKLPLLTSILGILCILVVIFVMLGVYRLYRKSCTDVNHNRKATRLTKYSDETFKSTKRKQLLEEYKDFESFSKYQDDPHTLRNEHRDKSQDSSKFLHKQLRSDSGYKSHNQHDKTDDEEWQESGQLLIINQLISNQQNYPDNMYFNTDEVSIAPAITLAQGYAGGQFQTSYHFDEKGVRSYAEKTSECNCHGPEYTLQYCRIQDNCDCRYEGTKLNNTDRATINCSSMHCMPPNYNNILPKDINFVCIPPEGSIDGSICTANQIASIEEINKSSMRYPAPEQIDTISGISV